MTIGCYGDPNLPKPAIDCNGTGQWHEDYRAPIGGSPHRNHGTVSTALLLRDCSHIWVHDLEITNRRTDDTDGMRFNYLDVMDRTGVAVIAENAGTTRDITLQRLDVHDVDGNVYDKHMANGGIYCIAHFPKTRRAYGRTSPDSTAYALSTITYETPADGASRSATPPTST